MKPKLFIGSSSEALTVVYALQAGLSNFVECTVWTQGSFSLSRTAIESLLETLTRSQFAAFVFNPDDTVIMRGAAESATRDNVVFELGLSIGMLGRWNTFMVVPAGVELHLPTDLLGITAARYEAHRSDGNLHAALGPAAMEIAEAVRQRHYGA